MYEHNFKKAPSVRSIEHLDADYIDSLEVDTWLMSPPCKILPRIDSFDPVGLISSRKTSAGQPYTSMGLQRDDEVFNFCTVFCRDRR